MLIRKLSIAVAVMASLALLPLPSAVVAATSDAQFRQIRVCYAHATLYEVFAERYIKGYSKKQSIEFVKSVKATKKATSKAVDIVKTAYRDKPEKKFSYALGKLKQCHHDNVPVVTDRISGLCYSLKGLAQIINSSKRSGKSYDETMAMIKSKIKTPTVVALAHTMGKKIYEGKQSITALQRSYYLTCVKTALDG